MRTRILLLSAFFQLATLAFGQKYEMWGVNYEGGPHNSGTIFKVDSNGNNFKVEYNFPILNGSNPNRIKLCEFSNGKLYGTTFDNTILGGSYLFEYDPILDTTINKVEFSNNIGNYPIGGLINVGNNKLYGVTSNGGNFYGGTIYSYDPNLDTLEVIHHFNGNSFSFPEARLLLASNGRIYGTTTYSSFGDGALFELNLSNNTVTIKATFDRVSSGREPIGGLIQASNGNLYGMTQLGGINSIGVLYEYNILTDTLIKKVDFVGLNGSKPEGSLFEASNGKLYGMTAEGGVNSTGVLFEYDVISSSLLKKYDFGSIDGTIPFGSFVEITTGVLMGMTGAGGVNGDGAIFEYDFVSNTFSKKTDFDGSVNGSAPNGDFTITSNGRIFGVTQHDDLGEGTLFEFILSKDSIELKSRFSYNELGANPISTLLQANNGKLYGTTRTGGVTSRGVIYEYDPILGKIQKIVDKMVNIPGKLTQTSNGKIYGMSEDGGALGGGFIFELDLQTKSIINIQDFSSILGEEPNGSLLQASNGKLYGMTSDGGLYNSGVIFEYNIINDSLMVLHNFNVDNPRGSLIQARNGNLYGMTYEGGQNSDGVIFEYNLTTNVYTVIHNFVDQTTGQKPSGDLLELPNGKLMGVTQSGGGSNNDGVLFEFDLLTNNYTLLSSFYKYSNGQEPHGNLILGFNGTLFGLTRFGGPNIVWPGSGDGGLFEYNPMTNLHQAKKFFNSKSDGANPFGSLTNVFICPFSYDTIQAYSCDVYQAPSGQLLQQSGQFIDIIPNSNGCDSIITIDLIVDHSTTRIDSHLVCNGTLQWVDGLTYNVSNDSATFIIPNGASNGCDSIILLNLTIENIDQSIIFLGNELGANERNAVYQWLDCSNNYSIIPNAINQIYRPTTSGSYAVELRKNGCIDTSACYPITVVGVDENQLSNNLAVFPNPTNSNVTLSIGGMYGAFTTQVYNVHGMLINESAHNSTNQVEVELGASEGIYFIHLITISGEKVVRKVVKN